ncbi:MAG: hypothetical protein K8R73_05440 [Clostridiales bacterium]|nr:hypothetical protein [Clostridiales bacterium]
MNPTMNSPMEFVIRLIPGDETLNITDNNRAKVLPKRMAWRLPEEKKLPL